MTGDGTQENPYTVASVADFRALDGKSGYVVMIADVDFNSAGGRESFSSINCGGVIYFNGQGYSIKNFYQETASDGGLFSNFRGTFENCDITDAYILVTGDSGNVGIVTDSLGVDCTFDNVNISGMINSSGAAAYIGGFVGLVSADVINLAFNRCKSVMNMQVSEEAGGFIGRFSYAEGGSIISFTDCVSACRMYRGKYTSGYIGYVRLSNGPMTFNRCISQCEMTDATRQSGFLYGKRVDYINCASVCSMKNGSYAYGFADTFIKTLQSYSKCIFDGCTNTYGMGNGEMDQSYAACSLINVPAGAHNCGLGTGNNYISYYDGDIFADTEGTAGAVTTEQLKSADWLREQGWAI